MISRIDIRDALSLLIANAPDKTPNVGEATELAWQKYFDHYRHWTGDELITAVYEYCKQPRERPVQPADIGATIRALYRDHLDRMDSDTRAQAVGQPSARRDHHGYIDKSAADELDYPADWTTEQRLAAYWATVDAHRDSQAITNPNTLLAERPTRSQQQHQQRLARVIASFGPDETQPRRYLQTLIDSPLRVTCPWCGATAGQRCHIPGPRQGRRDFLTKTAAHPARIQAAQEAL